MGKGQPNKTYRHSLPLIVKVQDIIEELETRGVALVDISVKSTQVTKAFQSIRFYLMRVMPFPM